MSKERDGNSTKSEVEQVLALTSTSRASAANNEAGLIEQVRSLARISDLLNRPADSRVVIEKILSEVCDLFNTTMSSVLLYTGDRKLHHYAGEGLPPSLIQKIEGLGRAEPVSNYVDSIDSPVIFCTAPADVLTPLIKRLVEEHGIANFLAAPIVNKGRALGFLGVYHRNTRSYTDDELDLLRTLANMAALVVARANLVDEPRLTEEHKDHFLSALSHELRTPLTSIMGFTQIIRKRLGSAGETDARLLEQLDVLWVQAHRLNRLIDTLVDITRIESGDFAIYYGKVEVTTLLRSTVQSSLLQMSSRHRVESNIPDRPVWVHGDKKRLEQVFNQVVTNAIRYSPEEEPITVTCGEDETGSGIIVEVIDQGPGIPANRRKNILEQTYRNDEPKTGGLGVGLYISKTIVEAHGGTISLHSEPQRGTRVTITLPA